MGDRWRAVAALVDRSRRALYVYVRGQDHPVTREEAADAQRVSRSLAAFHLDKLVDAGLLRARYEAPPGRRRGRGRAPKVYEPAGDGLTVTIPERRYQLIAEILADAVVAAPQRADDAASDHARRHGRDLGVRLRERGGTAGEVGQGAAVAGDAGPGEMPGTPTDLTSVLDALGFEPRRLPEGRVLLHNCPFQALATRHTELVCGMNHAFVGGLVDGLAARGVGVRLVPRPPACCVELIDVP